MDQLIHYFQHIPSAHRALILAGGITVFWLMESAVPLTRFRYNKWRHAGINFFFTFTTIIINFLFALLLVFSSDWCQQHGAGILPWIGVPVWAQLIIGLLVLDLIGAYCIHWIQHKIKWMWKFHMIHHADTHVDTTTANRHHPVESVFRAVFTILAVIVAGAPMWLVMLYQSLSVVLSQFNHANIKLAPWFNRTVGWLLVTPAMHRIHHHYIRPETDSNYGNIFPFWDKLFGTYHRAPAYPLQYGLDVLEGRNDESLKQQLLLPFDKNIKTDY
ncbi:sterol desaturase family protein [Deminuibacter soli]|uniref:Sterol desaturase family protein n=1 Tax=Deminuibacter soli TaxID=2291815 RepID=A0A3E1NR16_9BACT|nr:sterol desaturase family protein [Deminuibacter soli]RFM30347.1 sterol desaturase family protein [Deminuibacter soli]